MKLKRDSKGRFLKAASAAAHKAKHVVHHAKGKASTALARITGGGAKASGWRAEAMGAVPAVIVGGLAFGAVRLATYFGLGTKKDTGERRDSGWLGFVGNVAVLLLGWVALRYIYPAAAKWWLWGGGLAILCRGATAAFPAQAEYAGLTTTPSAGALGSGSEGAPGMSGITRANVNMGGVFRTQAA